MNRLITIAFLLLCLCARAVTGDVTSVTIDTNGWNCFVLFSGMGTNTPTFTNGMTANVVGATALVTNVLTGSEKFKLYVTSQGYDTNGGETHYTRTIYGTKMVRKPYPNQSLSDTSGAGGNATVNIALSEYVASADTISYDIASGLYSQGGVNNNSGTGSCDNNSLLTYPKTIANWTWYGWNAETNSTMRLSCFAYEQHARDRKPVACVVFTVSDALGETYSITNTQMERSRGAYTNEFLPAGEYVARIPLAGFTQGQKLVCNFKAYPWIGNTLSFADTSDGTHIMPSANAAPITNICNKTLGYGTVCAVVAPSTGNDSNGRCATNGDPTSITSDKYFATIGAALNIATGSNNTYFSHADTGGVNIYINDTTAATYCMTAKAYGARPDVIPTIQPYPGTTAIISNSAVGSSSQPTMMRFKGLTYSPSSGGTLNTSNNNWGVWIFDNCTMSAIDTAQVGATSASQSYSLVYVVDSAVPKWGQGFQCQGGGAKDTYALLRGCNLNGFTNKIMVGTLLGNYITQTNAGPNFYSICTDVFGQGAEIIDPQINYNNFWGCQQLNSSAMFAIGQNFNITNGYLFANNVMEFSTNANGSARWNMATSNGKNYTNLCYDCNVWAGCAMQLDYNDDTTFPSWRIWVHFAYNYMDNFDFKTDTFTGGSSGANGNRIGNWSVDYGAGFRCNVMNETAGFTAGSGSFLTDFCGLNTIGVNINNGDTAGGTLSICGALVRFIDQQSTPDGTTVRTGNGNYNFHSDSLVHRIKRLDVTLPYDLWGNARGDRSPIGPLSEADLNK